MRRLFASLAGAAGGLAAWRLLRRPRRVAPDEPRGPDPRAEELRAKLAETHAAEPEPEPAPEPPEQPSDPAARRREVHERGRAAIDEMDAGG